MNKECGEKKREDDEGEERKRDGGTHTLCH